MGRLKKSEATPTLEHRVERLYLVAHNFNERFIALETALAKLVANNSPAPAPRKRRGKSPSVAASD
jgi:hypothetical protein